MRLLHPRSNTVLLCDHFQDNKPSNCNVSLSVSCLDYQFLTSYTIRIFPETAECGGLNVLYSYININRVCSPKDLTSSYHSRYWTLATVYERLIFISLPHTGGYQLRFDCRKTKWSFKIWLLISIFGKLFYTN